MKRGTAMKDFFKFVFPISDQDIGKFQKQLMNSCPQCGCTPKTAHYRPEVTKALHLGSCRICGYPYTLDSEYMKTLHIIENKMYSVAECYEDEEIKTGPAFNCPCCGKKYIYNGAFLTIRTEEGNFLYCFECKHPIMLRVKKK